MNAPASYLPCAALALLVACSGDDAGEDAGNTPADAAAAADASATADSGAADAGAADTGAEDAGVDPRCEDVMPLAVDAPRGECSVTLPFTPNVTIEEAGAVRRIITNGIPDHAVGVFGREPGSLNPNAIAEVAETYEVPLDPAMAASPTALYDANRGPQYRFGVALNGVEIDPEAAEPWPHTRPPNFNTANWAWNLDAMSVNLGLDCNNAHVQPTGQYHYHGEPTLLLVNLAVSEDRMTLLGYAGDGFPIYARYGYQDAASSASEVVELASSYQLKSGDRDGDGDSSPCGAHSGIYVQDYEYVPGSGDLDECNGRQGVTPEFPGGTYYYVITDEFPFVGRCLKGTVSSDFRLGR